MNVAQESIATTTSFGVIDLICLKYMYSTTIFLKKETVCRDRVVKKGMRFIRNL